MKTLATVVALLCTSLALTAQAFDADATGQYLKPADASATTLSSQWAHWPLATGGSRISVSFLPAAINPGLEQDFFFSSTHLATRYAFRSTPGKGHPALSMSCDYLPAAVSCTGSFESKPFTTSLAAPGPKVFLPEAFVDHFWLNAAVCSLAARTPGKTTDVKIVSMVDSDRTEGVDLGVVDTLHILYAGTESLNTLSGPIQAHKFTYDTTTVWTSPTGLVLALQLDPDSPTLTLTSLNDPQHRLLP